MTRDFPLELSVEQVATSIGGAHGTVPPQTDMGSIESGRWRGERGPHRGFRILEPRSRQQRRIVVGRDPRNAFDRKGRRPRKIVYEFADYLHPEDKSAFHSALDRTLRHGRTIRLHAPDRDCRRTTSASFDRSARYDSDADGKPVELLGVTFDVTERDRAAVALRESENTLNAIVNSTTAMIYIKDTESKYLLVNRHFEEVFGVDDRELRGKTDYEFLPKEVADSVRANDKLVREAGRAVEFEELVPHQDEDHIYISIKFPLRRLSGEIYAVCGISTDITERKRAEAELESTKLSLERIVDERTATLRETNRRLQEEIAEREETASRLRRLIDTAREGIWVIDEVGCTTFANPRMAEILGYEASEMIGRPMFAFMTEERRKEAAANLERRRQGIAEDHDFEFQRKDGSRVWTLISTSPVHDKDGNWIGALAMVTDITERKHGEEYQALLLQELDHRVKNTLATVAALSDLTMAGASSLLEFAKAFEGRIQAMARTHEALARSKWKGVSLEELATLVLAPFRTGDSARISACGAPGLIPPNAISPLALTLNELGTNAAKHGALSDTHGTVELAWEIAPDERVSLTWREGGGPPVQARPSEGTGLQLIRGLIEYELGGSLSLEFAPAGLVCRVEIPISKVE